VWLLANEWGGVLLYNGLGRYEEALAAAERAAENPRGMGLWIRDQFEHIEAAVRSGRPERAAAPLAKLAEIAEAAGTDWALGSYARSAALLAEGESAERLYQEAIQRLSGTRGTETLARAHLLYGEWLRREGRRVDAREQLRTAYAMLTQVGMEAFAERARVELAATGERVRKRTVESDEELTAHERQIAQLACEGLSNREIGERLFISSRTVEWHMHKVFAKRGVSSRTQLARALAGGVSEQSPA
jgi:ATP/maltotriose-dependent transcriptional regulator MalT